MKEYHPPLGGRDAMRLDFNENTVACSPRVLEALAEIAGEHLTKYPERALGGSAGGDPLGLEPEQVVLTNGVDEAIHVLCETYLDCGQEMLLPVPTYTMYEVYASGTDGRAVQVQAAADFAFPFERLMSAITAADEDYCDCESEQPDGQRWLGAREILALCERAPQAVVLVDEAYFHFHGETVAGSDWEDSEPDGGADILEGLRAGGFAAGIAGRGGGEHALDSARAFALQRELAGAGVPACGA